MGRENFFILLQANFNGDQISDGIFNIALEIDLKCLEPVNGYKACLKQVHMNTFDVEYRQAYGPFFRYVIKCLNRIRLNFSIISG